MGKVIIEFDSNEESEDIRVCLDGYKYKLVLWDLDQHLRAEIKYNEKLPSEITEAYDNLRDKIREFLNDYNINLE